MSGTCSRCSARCADDIVAVIVAVGALFLAFWVRAAGTAITRVPRADALRDGSDDIAGAAVVAALLDEREVIAPAVGVVASAFLILASVVATVIAVTGQSLGASVIGAIGIAIVAFFVGDLVPRQIGRRRPHKMAYRSAWLLAASVKVGSRANDLLPEPQGGDDEEDEGDTEDTDDQERELIDSVLEFSETIVREVMTPRPDMTTIPMSASIEELIELSTEEGFSRVPVFSNDDIVGVVILRDLLPMLTEDQRPASLADVMRPIEFIPETKLASALLTEMQEGHLHQMIVVDEYGDIAGLVTIEDLLEELVGEIADETDLEERLITANGEVWAVDARLPVDELAEATSVVLPDDEWDTVGGLILALAERVPEEGEEFDFEQLTLKVTKMQGRRVSEVEVMRSDRLRSI